MPSKSRFFANSPEFLDRKYSPYVTPDVTLSELYAAVPRHLFRKSTTWGVYYAMRDATLVFLMYQLGCRLDTWLEWLSESLHVSPALGNVIRWVSWSAYWPLQGLSFAGLWTLAHEAGHGTLSDFSWVNHMIGFFAHTFLFVPYFAFRATHSTHHKKAASIEGDENYVPRTRSQFNLPPADAAGIRDYHAAFEDSPLYCLIEILVMQLAGLPAYLIINVRGSHKYPLGTNHFSPFSPLFKPRDRFTVLVSDVGLALMAFLCYTFITRNGLTAFIRLYFVPYLWVNCWILTVTYVQHTDPTVPHYRKGEWTFLRGALSTVDRPALGWMGRFFLKNLGHDHVTHHLFSSVPFYNQPQVTKLIKPVLKQHYNYDSTNLMWALYRSFTECRFIEDEGDIVFFKDSAGNSTRLLCTEISMDT
ncbi:Fatty acid conjugase [Mycena indigotica]|uniref:Fatty acid conjugase n=1 Tax=Mycena indigotica TaxID=2126181 RepID=A0A8H6WF02_9AGAR|nr:Fatty acid conjugase [Mycena indigotica]KAF7312378.1 Fatty acid conjugase [Mycena indigotica]